MCVVGYIRILECMCIVSVVVRSSNDGVEYVIDMYRWEQLRITSTRGTFHISPFLQGHERQHATLSLNQLSREGQHSIPSLHVCSVQRNAVSIMILVVVVGLLGLYDFHSHPKSEDGMQYSKERIFSKIPHGNHDMEWIPTTTCRCKRAHKVCENCPRLF
jgi:hypothetical protein